MIHVFDIGIRALCLVFALWFIVAYSKVNWKAWLEGRHLMWFTRMIVCFMTLTLMYVIFGSVWWYAWVARALFTWLAYLLYRRVQLQRAAQRELDSLSTKPELNTPVGNEYREEE